MTKLTNPNKENQMKMLVKVLVVVVAVSIGLLIGKIVSAERRANEAEKNVSVLEAEILGLNSKVEVLEAEAKVQAMKKSLFVRSTLGFEEIETQDALIRWNLNDIENQQAWKEVKIQ